MLVRRTARLAVVLSCSVAGFACDSPAPGQQPKAATAPTSSTVAGATSAAPSVAATATTPIASATALPLGSGAAPVSRPPNGIFAAGEADAILKRGEGRRVTLLDPGSEPREVVAYRIAPGATQKVSLALELAMAMNPAGARPKLTKMPRTET